MQEFGKSNLRSAESAQDSAHEAPPVEQTHGQPVSGGTTAGLLTPEDVHNITFSKAPVGERGYNEDEVDAFLDVIAEALQDPPGNSLTPDDVHNVAFSDPPIVKRGYDEAEVDAFLDRVEEAMRHRGTGTDS